MLGSRWLKLLIASAVITAPSAAKSQPTGAAFRIVESKFFRDGTCAFRLEMTNLTIKTLEVSGQVFLVNDDGVTLGSTPALFPPAVAGGKSRLVAPFHSFQLAARCKKPLTVVVQPQVCRFADGTYLNIEFCRSQEEAVIDR